MRQYSTLELTHRMMTKRTVDSAIGNSESVKLSKKPPTASVLHQEGGRPSRLSTGDNKENVNVRNN